ncbi:hypothetical protein [Yinghuangia soli]|uniref:Uncharacterized protein n=1 Tax=Yinghuangia soli TaxID=2908204 RepID=A0AA41PWC5_9ACTN|nr:hypothetical protein [Yinghuangia soli]MCF2525732.1 hypothetical protein [Yinghuangia soli]
MRDQGQDQGQEQEQDQEQDPGRSGGVVDIGAAPTPADIEAARRRRLAEAWGSLVGSLVLMGAISAVGGSAAWVKAVGMVVVVAGAYRFITRFGGTRPTTRAVQRIADELGWQKVTFVEQAADAARDVDGVGRARLVAADGSVMRLGRNPWSSRKRRYLAEAQGGQVWFAGDFRTSGVVALAGGAEPRLVGPPSNGYLELGDRETDRGAGAAGLVEAGTCFVAVPDHAGADFVYDHAGEVPKTGIEAPRLDRDGVAGTFHMDADGFRVTDGDDEFSLAWGELAEVVFLGKGLVGLLRGPYDGTWVHPPTMGRNGAFVVSLTAGADLQAGLAGGSDAAAAALVHFAAESGARVKVLLPVHAPYIETSAG